MPARALRRADWPSTLRPSKMTLPLRGRTRPHTAASTELLPAPFDPRIATSFPRGTENEGALFGAPLPIIATVLVTAGDGEPWYLVAYMVGAALISFIAVLAAVETSKGDIEQLDAPFDEASSRPVVG